MSTLPANSKKTDPPIKLVEQRYELIELDAVRPYPGNPNEGDIGAVYESQKVNGFYGAIYVQESTGYIVAGHTRYYAARHGKAAVIPCIWLNIDDPTAVRIVAADNRTRDLARYDDAALEALLAQAIEDSGTLAGTGFDDEFFNDLQSQIGPDFGSGNRDTSTRHDDPDAGTETGQGGVGGSGPAEIPEDDTPGALKRLGVGMLWPDDHATITKAIETALERQGAKVANMKRKTKARGLESGNAGQEYNALTLGLIAVAVSYLEATGQAASIGEGGSK